MKRVVFLLVFGCINLFAGKEGKKSLLNNDQLQNIKEPYSPTNSPKVPQSQSMEGELDFSNQWGIYIGNQNNAEMLEDIIMLGGVTNFEKFVVASHAESEYNGGGCCGSPFWVITEVKGVRGKDTVGKFYKDIKLKGNIKKYETTHFFKVIAGTIFLFTPNSEAVLDTSAILEQEWVSWIVRKSQLDTIVQKVESEYKKNEKQMSDAVLYNMLDGKLHFVTADGKLVNNSYLFSRGYVEVVKTQVMK